MEAATLKTSAGQQSETDKSTGRYLLFSDMSVSIQQQKCKYKLQQCRNVLEAAFLGSFDAYFSVFFIHV